MKKLLNYAFLILMSINIVSCGYQLRGVD